MVAKSERVSRVGCQSFLGEMSAGLRDLCDNGSGCMLIVPMLSMRI